MMIRGAQYWLKNNLYLALTNETNSVSHLALRGPSFKMPETSGFFPLEEGKEPTAEHIYDIVDNAFTIGKIEVSSMESNDITFAGLGEPLLRIDTLTSAAELIKEKRHGAVLRVKTNGLVQAKQSAQVAADLANAGISKVSICLASDNPKQYLEIMQPRVGAGGFPDVCAFVIACSEAGLDVTCTAVERPGVSTGRVRDLAHSLGAANFATASFHP